MAKRKAIKSSTRQKKKEPLAELNEDIRKVLEKYTNEHLRHLLQLWKDLENCGKQENSNEEEW